MKIKLPFIKDLKILKTGSMSLRIRLFVFLSVLVVVMVCAVFIILLLTGRISQDYSAPLRFAEKEFSDLLNKIQNNAGETSVQLISLSQSLSRSIEFQLSERGIEAERLSDYPEILTEIIGNEVNRLQLGLERTECSGVFMILDATVNPNLPDAEFSKAGIYLRRFEPEVSGTPEVRYFFYRGFINIAHQNNFFMRATWDMEFNIENCNYYRETINIGKTSDLPLSRMFYWSLESVIPELNEPTILCSIPLIDSHGNVFGLAGFEISSWNFNVNYTPDNSEYKDIICLFGKLQNNTILIPGALVSGSPPAIGKIRGKESLVLTEAKGLNAYVCKNGIVYMGLHEKVKIYSADSPFNDQNFIVSILLPKDEIDLITMGVYIRIALICIGLLVIGIAGSIFISARYLEPITSALDGIKTGNIAHTDKTKIAEIDSVLEYIGRLAEERRLIEQEAAQLAEQKVKQLAKQRSVKTAVSAEPAENTSAKDNLEANSLEQLNYQELRIADLTLRGYSYTGIAEVLKIKPNTVKWYQKELYSKLGINSKRELFELASHKGTKAQRN